MTTNASRRYPACSIMYRMKSLENLKPCKIPRQPLVHILYGKPQEATPCPRNTLATQWSDSSTSSKTRPPMKR